MKIRAFKFLVAAVGLASSLVAQAYTGLFVFGDSLSDNGNAALFGKVDATQVIQAVPPSVLLANMYVPDKAYSSNVFSNGPVWADQFASMIGVTLTPSGPTGTGGTNFAVGGAKTSGGTLPLKEQVSNFITSLGNSNAAPSNALYVIAGGGNNVRDTFVSLANQTNLGTIGSTIGTDSAKYATDIEEMYNDLYAKGARNFVIWNAPNVGLTPALRSIPMTASGLTGSQLGSLIAGSFNGVLANRLAGKAGVMMFDVYGLLDLASTNGFTNLTDACGAPSNAGVCSDLSKAVFWDGIHPTTAAHGLIAQQMFALAVPEPSEIAMMLMGLLVVVGASRRKTA